MGTVTKPNTFVNGTTANATEVNSNFDTLYTLVNGNIDNDNVKGAAGIVFSKLDSATVAGVDETQTLTNKTLTTPVIASIYQDAAKTKLMTLPDTTSDTLVALDASQTLTNKTLTAPVLDGTITGTYTLGGTPTATSPTITGSPTASGSTWTDLGSITTADINGGTIDATTVGATTPAAGKFTTVEGTTGTFSGAVTVGAVSNVPLLVPGQVQNLSWTKSAGVITIAGADGTALSATNPAWVCVPSAVTAGTFVVLPITTNITFNDDNHASSHLASWTFGVTSGTAWANVLPVTFYFLNKDDSAAGLVFGISRNPRATTFATADIGDKDANAGTPAQTNIFVAASITESDYNNKPAIPVGAGYMSKTAADDWTFYQDTLNGFGEFIRDRVYSATYTFPLGQNGAANSSGTGTNGPTWATPASITSLYTLSRNGEVMFRYSTGNAGNCTNGGDANTTIIYLPLKIATYDYLAYSGFSEVIYGGSNTIGKATTDSTMTYVYSLNYSTIAPHKNNGFDNAGDDIYLSLRYKAF